MTLPPRVQQACDEMRGHLDQFDWSKLTNGRRQVLEAFLELATTQGFSGVTMRGLAKALDVKPSSIYFHFPDGRDEIVAQTLRWHYHGWGSAILSAVENSASASEFWDSMIRTHVKRQLELPESDLWDILVATDRICGFLQPGIRQEIEHWLQLCVQMYEAAACEMGYNNCEVSARAIMKLLDGVRSWCDWSGPGSDLEACTARAIAMSRAILSSQSDEANSSIDHVGSVSTAPDPTRRR